MSWDEVHKINSDFQREPLNFNNYINDISTFGQYSYVLDPENSRLWRELISRSLTMFGHAAIHETVYNRLTDDDVDYMIRKNARIGQAFNSFYAANNFASGKIDTVLSRITSTTYNVLETKLQHGINRYVSEMTADETAGEWLGTVFGVDALKTKTDVASIISDTDLWTNTIMANESLRYVICLSATVIDWFATNDSSVYVDFLNEVCNSTKATTDLFTAITGADKLETFMNTESVMTVVASKQESMIALTYMTAPFAAMIASETAMNIVVNSDVAINVIVDSLTNVANSETVLDTIKTNLTSIEDSLPNIANSETNISEVADVKTHVADVILSLQKTTSQTDILIANMTALISSATAMSAIIYNDTARLKIEGSDAAINAIYAVKELTTMAKSINGTVTIENSGVYFIRGVRSTNSSNNYRLAFSNIISGNISGSWTYFYTYRTVNRFADTIKVSNSSSSSGVIIDYYKLV